MADINPKATKGYIVLKSTGVNSFNADDSCGLASGIYSLTVTIDNITQPKLPSLNSGRDIFIYVTLAPTYTWQQVADELKYKINTIGSGQETVVIEEIKVNNVSLTIADRKYKIVFYSGIVGSQSYINIAAGPTSSSLDPAIALMTNFKGDLIAAINAMSGYSCSIETPVVGYDTTDEHSGTAVVIKKHDDINTYYSPERIPIWRQYFGFGNDLRGITIPAQKGLNKINVVLEKGDDMLASVQAYLSLIKRIESALSRGIYIFLDALINYAQNMVDAVKSTGIYGLDLTTYHLRPVDLLLKANDSDVGGNAWYETEPSITINNQPQTFRVNIPENRELTVNDVVNNDLIKSSYRQALVNVYNTLLKYELPTSDDLRGQYLRDTLTPTQYDNYINFVNEAIQVRAFLRDAFQGTLKDSRNLNRLNRWISDNIDLGIVTGTDGTNLIGNLTALSYKTETYDEFIQEICNAFTDENDKPATGLNIALKRRRQFQALPENVRRDIIRANSSNVRIGASFSSYTNDWFQSGRPEFPAGTDVTMYLIAFAMPDFMEILEMWKSLNTIFKGQGDAIWDACTSIIPTFCNSPLNFDGYEGLLRRYDNRDPSVNTIRGPEPNFYGITLNRIFPELFEIIEDMLGKLRGLRFTVHLSTIDAIDQFVRSLRNFIYSIQTLIDLINRLLRMVEQLINFLGKVHVLKITTNRGNAGVIEQLRAARSFFVSMVTTNKILEAFNLNGEEIASLDEDPMNAKEYIERAESLSSRIDKVSDYRDWLEETIASSDEELVVLNSELTSLNDKRARFVVIRDEVIELEANMTAYNDYKANAQAEIALYNEDITAHEATHEDWLYNTFDEIDNPEGYKNRQWIEDEIASFEEELSPTSAFNTNNAEEQNNIQMQIDELDRINADPYAPQNPNYATERATLVEQKNNLINAKSEHDDLYNGKKTTYTNAKNAIDAFIASIVIDNPADLALIDDQIDQLKIDQDALKAMRNAEYNDYLAAREDKQDTIDSNTIDIETKTNSIVTKQGQIASKEAEIAYRFAINPADPQIPILEAEVAVLEADINTLENEIADLQDENETLAAEIEQLDADMEAYDENHTKLEEEKALQIWALGYWKEAESERLQIESITDERDTYASDVQTELDSMMSDLIDEYAPSINSAHYATEITYLSLYEGFNVTLPTSNPVKNAINKMDVGSNPSDIIRSPGSITITQRQRDALSSRIVDLQNVLNKLPQGDTFDTKLAELHALDENDIFDPNEKMYYGGFLTCWSFPGSEDQVYNPAFNMTTAIAELTREWEYVEGDIQVTNEDFNESKKMLNMIFK